MVGTSTLGAHHAKSAPTLGVTSSIGSMHAKAPTLGIIPIDHSFNYFRYSSEPSETGDGGELTSPKGKARNDKANLELGLTSESQPRVNSESELSDEEDTKMYDDYDVQSVSQEELAFWSELAPEGQKLTDVDKLVKKTQLEDKMGQGASRAGVPSEIMLKWISEGRYGHGKA